MDNEQKVQEAQVGQTTNEQPDEVQNNAELREQEVSAESTESQEVVESTGEPSLAEEAESIAAADSGENATSHESDTEEITEEVGATSDDTVTVVEGISQQVSETEPESIQDEVAAVEEHGEVVQEGNTEALEEEEQQEEGQNVVAEEEKEEQEEEVVDFSTYSKEQLIAHARELLKETDVRRLDRHIKLLKPKFDEFYEREKNEALQRFVSDGNDPDNFEFRDSEEDRDFFHIYSQLRSRKSNFFKELDNQREENTRKKEQILNKIRQIVDGEETDHSFKAVRSLQEEWKKVGPVQGQMNKTLWANYNALLDRFYDQQSIYYELKDLDRKKNQKQKEELCERAESLLQVSDLRTAIMQLNELHEEYKHIGPVPKEVQEQIWLRFKAASDAIYAKRKEFVESLKTELESNFEKKQQLVEDIKGFVHFNSDKIGEWNKKTKEVLEIQRKWEAVGGVPRAKAKAINKDFWQAFKQFFAGKNAFFKELESHRDENLVLKEELIKEAEALKDSTEWDATTQKMKDLQTRWKEIGPVPEKVRNEVYEKFKAACDHFFNNRRSENQQKNHEQESNLKMKLEICDRIENIVQQDEIDLDDIYDLIDNHNAIGFVPRNAINKSKKRFDRAIDKVLAIEELTESDRIDLKNHLQYSRMRASRGQLKSGDNHREARRENSIKRKISSLENEISTWNTNMEFFAKSAKADELKADLQNKIDAAEQEITNLQRELRELKN